MKKTLISILAVSIFPFSPVLGREVNDTVTIYFHQGKSDIDSVFHDNDVNVKRLDSIALKQQNLLNDIRILGTASPEGGISLNNKLSDRRAERILSILCQNQSYDPSLYSISFSGRDWKGLLDEVERDKEVPYREETLILLKEINEKIESQGEELEKGHFLERLKALKNGEPYAYLYSNIFPSLRTSKVFLRYTVLPVFDGNTYIPNLSVPPLNPEAVFSYTPTLFSTHESRNFYMALKTNMLYDALALPSIGAEFYLGKNFSAVANWTYGWWDNNRTHHYWRAYGGDIAVRWWFGKKAAEKPLTGHHLGLYGGVITFDFELGGKGYMGGLPRRTLWDRCMSMAGIEYGYSLPIAKRFNIDFTIGIGYLGGKYIEYIPDKGRYLWQSTHKLNWFGPTKAEVSLVWLIGNGNYNSPKKGGEL